MTPACSSASPTCAGVQPCTTSTTMSALPAVELSTLLSTQSDATASGVQERRDHDERGHVAPVGAGALCGPPPARRPPLRLAGHRSMVPTPRPRPPARARLPLMRFGIKTSPQDTTWADMLAVWQAADEIELFESAWTFDHFYPIFTDDIDRALPRGLGHHHRAGPGDASAPGRRAGHRHRRTATRRCSPTWRPRSTSSPAAGWSWASARAGTRWRPSAYGIDLHATLTERFDAFDEACEAIVGLLTDEQTDLRRPLRAARRRVLQPEAGAAAAPADLHRRPGRAPHAAHRWRGSRSTGTSRADAVEQFAAKLDVLHAHCADLGRDPAEITVSTHLRLARAASTRVAEQAKRYADAGLDLGIVYLQTPHTPDVLGELADALAPLAG